MIAIRFQTSISTEIQTFEFVLKLVLNYCRPMGIKMCVAQKASLPHSFTDPESEEAGCPLGAHQTQWLAHSLENCFGSTNIAFLKLLDQPHQRTQLALTPRSCAPHGYGCAGTVSAETHIRWETQTMRSVKLNRKDEDIQTGHIFCLGRDTYITTNMHV